MSNTGIKAVIKSILKRPVTLINTVFLKSYIKSTKLWNSDLKSMDISDSRVLIFAPHQDDEVIGCGCLIQGMVKNGCSVKTVFFTDGSKSLSYEHDCNSLKSIRKEEAKKVAELLNMETPAFLDLPDGELEVNDANARSLASVIDEFRPDYILFPYFLDGHKDHVAVSGLMLSSLKYTNKNEAVEYFAYEINSPISAEAVSHYFNCDGYLDEKKGALELYKSQIMSFDSLLLMNLINASIVNGSCKAVELYKKVDINSYKKVYEKLNNNEDIYKQFGLIYSLYFMIPNYLKGIKYKKLAASMLKNNMNE